MTTKQTGAQTTKPPKLKIGLYDSGIGGLTVLKELIQTYPEHDYIYLGDNQRAPYGNKPIEKLWYINQELIQFLMDQEISILVLACNTSCALFLDKIQQKLPVPVVGLLPIAAKKAVEKSPNQRISILATQRTAEQHAYQSEIAKIAPQSHIQEIPCPKLVPIIENNQISDPNQEETITYYLKEALSFKPDTIIYGCTHYPYLAPIWRYHCPPHIHLINPAEHISETIDPLIPKSINSILFLLHLLIFFL